jgi:hypothetical protein
MLHLTYILAFTIIAFLAVSNLIRSLITVSIDSQRSYSSPNAAINRSLMAAGRRTPHPELLDEAGNPINEPLLVMRSVSVEDARQRLDAIYEASPSQPADGISED